MKTDPSPASATHVHCGSVAGLWRYPVKSMMGEELNAAEVTNYGLMGDRKFAVVDPVTERSRARRIPASGGTPSSAPPMSSPRTRGRRDLRPADPARRDHGHKRPAWPSAGSVQGARPGGHAREAPGEGGAPAATAEEYWPDMEGLDYRDTVTDWELPPGTFFDLAIVHLLTTATIDRLRALYPPGRFEVRRFRPNIVVATSPDAQGFVENEWIGHAVAIGDEVRLQVTGPCPRCVMTTLAQGDLPKDSGILRTAAQHNQVNVGVYADVIAGGTVRRGDPVTLI